MLLAETLSALLVRPGGRYGDATLGLGGHAEAILRASAPDGQLWGVDKDPAALALARRRLAPFGERVHLTQGSYAEPSAWLPAEALDGIVADLGVSSPQLDEPQRGFSFMREGPLDMRMDPTQPLTARQVLASTSAEEWERRLREVGEARFARRLAQLLAEEGPGWLTTEDASQAVCRCVPRRGGHHPATRVFLALRRAVNHETEELTQFLAEVHDFLAPGGRLAVITFHSTEDRQVKIHYGREGVLRPVRKKPIHPTWPERQANPRSRSALLRIFEKPL